MATTERRGRPRSDREARGRALVQAALDVFAEKGFAGARLDDVAARAGVAKGTIYLYFATKDALFEAVVKSRILPTVARIEALAADGRTPSEDLLRGAIGAFYREVVAGEGREVLRLLLAEAPRFPSLAAFYHDAVIARGLAALKAIIARGVARGEFKEGPVTRRPEAVMGPAILAAVWKIAFEAHRPLDLDAYVEAHCALALAGLKAGTPSTAAAGGAI
ncbi:MAG: TetR/AcrR family transcriptional regulator [Geminicoccaceae bacterium]|nr:TetR/AcrR family transcriptional regulator [Geminicoccaceae bacterium]